MTAAARLAAAALAKVSEVLHTLDPAQLEDLAAGRGTLVFEPTEPGRASPAVRREDQDKPVDVDVAAAVEAIAGLASPREVADHLQRERYTVPALRAIATALGPTVSTAARSKADLQRNIVEGTAGFRTRSAAMSGGAWS